MDAYYVLVLFAMCDSRWSKSVHMRLYRQYSTASQLELAMAHLMPLGV